MRLIDIELTREQFDELDPATRDLLRSAMTRDIRTWAQRLVDSWASNDAEEVRRARHTLKGLTGNFGAARLHGLASADHADEAHARAVIACAEETIQAILDQSV